MSFKSGGHVGGFGSVITNPEGDMVEIIQSRGPNSHSAADQSSQQKPTLLQRPCMYLTKFVKSLPVIFITLVLSWSYYAFVVSLLLTAMDGDVTQQVVFGVFYHVIFLMLLWSYSMIIFTSPGTVPSEWFLSPAAVADLAAAQTEDEWKGKLVDLTGSMACRVKQRSVQGAIRYCEKCQCIKPDRSHHCSVCDMCTLKMDHHCPWVNNCVGFSNYKMFVLFLCYALLYCTYIACSTSRYFIMFWSEKLVGEIGVAKYHIIFVALVSVFFTISLSSLFWYHIWLLLHNRSTLEQFRAPVFYDMVSDKDGWNLGRFNNFKEIFGSNPFLWFIPVKSLQGDGLHFSDRRTLTSTQYNSIGNYTVSRPETPNRTLVNPILNSGGEITTTQTIHSNSASRQHSAKVSVLSGAVTPATLSPECATEVVIDNNGHVKTVPVPTDGEFTEIVLH